MHAREDRLVPDEAPRPPFDRLLGFFSYPLPFFVTGVLAFHLVQVFLPTIRIGVDTVWQPELRLLFGLVAILPAIVDMTIFDRRCRKMRLGPRFPAGQVFAAAVIGAALAALIAWSLGAQLSLGLGIVAFFSTVIWIWVTGVVAAYFAGAIWHYRLYRRSESAVRHTF
jgi:hypothetical protein